MAHALAAFTPSVPSRTPAIKKDMSLTPEMIVFAETVALLLAVGGIGGFLSGLLGIGGGFIYTPTLYFVFRLIGYEGDHAMHVAIGTSLSAIVLNSLSSARAHHARGSVDIDLFKLWLPFTVIGVVSGTLLASSLSSFTLKCIFAALTGMIAIYMFFEVPVSERKKVAHITASMHRFCAMIIGALATMIGVGGAIMTVPLLNYGGMRLQRAIGTASAIGILVAIPGSASYLISGLIFGGALPPYTVGFINWAAVLAIVPLAAITVPIGARLSYKLPNQILRKIFASFLVIVSLKMATSLLQ